jgi:hypothetical protein
MSLEEVYSQLPQEQRTALAQQFMQQFQQNGTAQQFANIDLSHVTAKQLVEMHDHAAQNHPGFLKSLTKHPLLIGVLGGLAAYEVDRHFNK